MYHSRSGLHSRWAAAVGMLPTCCCPWIYCCWSYWSSSQPPWVQSKPVAAAAAAWLASARRHSRMPRVLQQNEVCNPVTPCACSPTSVAASAATTRRPVRSAYCSPEKRSVFLLPVLQPPSPAAAPPVAAVSTHVPVIVECSPETRTVWLLLSSSSPRLSLERRWRRRRRPAELILETACTRQRGLDASPL